MFYWIFLLDYYKLIIGFQTFLWKGGWFWKPQHLRNNIGEKGEKTGKVSQSSQRKSKTTKERQERISSWRMMVLLPASATSVLFSGPMLSQKVQILGTEGRWRASWGNSRGSSALKSGLRTWRSSWRRQKGKRQEEETEEGTPQEIDAVTGFPVCGNPKTGSDAVREGWPTWQPFFFLPR